MENKTFSKVTGRGKRKVCFTACILIPFALVCLSYLLLGCSKPEPQTEIVPTASSQEEYLKSERELARGNYRQAYREYQKALADDPTVANMSHLSSILYAWAISESDSQDVPLLEAQKKVWLKPQQIVTRKELLVVSVNREKGVMHAFGLGFAPRKSPNPAQREMMAREAAMADAQAWVARINGWSEKDINRPFDVSQTVVGVETLKEFWVDNTIYVVKVRAPVNRES